MKDGDLSKLPKWAQNRIKRLEADLAHTKAKLANDDWGTFVADPFGDPRPIKSDHVQCQARIGKISVSAQDGGVSVRCTDGSLYVIPEASNSVHLVPVRYTEEFRS